MKKRATIQYKLALTLLLATSSAALSDREVFAETSEELIEKKAQVDLKIEQLNEQVEAIKAELQVEIEHYNQTKKLIEQAASEMKELHQKIKLRKDVLNDRLKAYQTYESNLNIYVEAVFGSKNLVEMMSRVSSVNTIIEADKTLYAEHKAAQLAVGKKRVELNELQREQEARYQSMQIKEADLELKIAEVKLMSLQLVEEIVEAQERERMEAERRAAELEFSNLQLLQGTLDATGIDNPPPQLGNIANGVAKAKTFLGMPYVWGGMHPATSFDCSGLIYWSYQQEGVSIPRTSRQQYAATVRLKKEDVLPGDLVFFAYDGRIGHVGIYIGDGKMLNSQNAGVVIESIDGWKQYFAGYGRVVN